MPQPWRDRRDPSAGWRPLRTNTSSQISTSRRAAAARSAPSARPTARHNRLKRSIGPRIGRRASGAGRRAMGARHAETSPLLAGASSETFASPRWITYSCRPDAGHSAKQPRPTKKAGEGIVVHPPEAQADELRWERSHFARSHLRTGRGTSSIGRTDLVRPTFLLLEHADIEAAVPDFDSSGRGFASASRSVDCSGEIGKPAGAGVRLTLNGPAAVAVAFHYESDRCRGS